LFLEKEGGRFRLPESPLGFPRSQNFPRPNLGQDDANQTAGQSTDHIEERESDQTPGDTAHHGAERSVDQIRALPATLPANSFPKRHLTAALVTLHVVSPQLSPGFPFFSVTGAGEEQIAGQCIGAKVLQ
jgi:hypothetical protein